jgi:hypothetical protein
LNFRGNFLESFASHSAAMTKTASFGRRGAAASSPSPSPRAAPLRDEITLTPEQRAVIFTAPDADVAMAKAPAASPRLAANLAALSITLPVVAFTFHPARDGDALIALSLGWSLFSVGADLAANLWLTRKICGWLGWSGAPAFFLTGAAISWAFSLFNAAIGLGDDLTPALSIPAGGAAAALYWFLSGRGGLPESSASRRTA